MNGKIPVLFDGGVRRGTDVFKALALGAKGVGIGRPMLWGLGSFGQAGVDRVLEILQAELKLVMGNCGTQTIRRHQSGIRRHARLETLAQKQALPRDMRRDPVDPRRRPLGELRVRLYKIREDCCSI